jgi:hypothetical protein
MALAMVAHSDRPKVSRHVRMKPRRSPDEIRKLAAAWKAPTHEDIIKQQQAERAERDSALPMSDDVPTPMQEVEIIQLGNADLQQTYELLIGYTVPYEREKAWVFARPGWGTVQISGIDPWALMRKPSPIEPPSGFNLTTSKKPQPDPSDVAVATDRLQRHLGQLEELELIKPYGVGAQNFRLFYGRAMAGRSLERDPTPVPSEQVKKA